MLCPHWQRLGSTKPAALDLPLSTATGPILLCDLGECSRLSEPQLLESGNTITHSWEVCVVGAAALSPPAAAASKSPRGVSAPVRGGHPWPEPLGRQVGGPLAASAKAGSCLAARTWGREAPSQPDS